MADGLPTTRSEAKVIGAKAYLGKKPCPLGHNRGRWTSNGRCVECSKASFRQWHSDNRDRSIQKSRNWREQNMEYHLEQARIRAMARFRSDPEAYRVANKKYRCTDAARAKAKPREKEWRMANREAVRLHSKRGAAVRRARKIAAGGSFSVDDIRELFRNQLGKCAYFQFCRSEFKDGSYHIDHIMPLARGGNNSKENLQLLCKTCNLRKGARDPLEFVVSIGISL